MKKLLSLLLSLSFILSGIVVPEGIGNLFPVRTTAAAQTSTDSWTYDSYTYNGVAGLVLTGYTGTDTDVYVPGKMSVDGADLPVLKLGDGIFANNTGLNSVTLATGIKVIGDGAFAGTTNLVCIVTNEDLEEIGANSFNGCSAFNSIILYDSITAIGENAFAGCGSLTVYCNENTTGYNYALNNDIPYVILNPDATPETYVVDGITYYIMNGEAVAVAFDNSSTEVVVPAVVEGYPMTDISTAFKGSKIVSISLPETITTITDYAFSYCTALTTVELSSSMNAIGSYAFDNCYALANIVLPDGIETISERAFTHCHSLTNITIPDSVTTLESGVFNACVALVSINIPKNITYIKDGTFNNCQKLEDITIPNGITSIGASAFLHCKSLVNIELPNSITSISDSAFEGCENLKSIIIPGGITTIKKETFSSCSSLESVILPDSITAIEDNAFNSCNSLEYISIPTNVNSISTSAFPGTTILLVEENSYAHSFAAENNLLFFITSGDEKPETSIVNGVKYFLTNGEAIAISFDNSITDVEVPSTVNDYPVTDIQTAFSESSITKITLPETITTIDDFAFANCEALKEVNIPNSVTSIGSSAFSRCYALENITIPNSVTSIGDSAFEYCRALTSLTIPGSVKTICQKAFYSCTKISDLVISNGVESIGYYAFYDCRGLRSLTVPGSIKTIGNSAFIDCYHLTSLTIENGVSEIENGAFSGCSVLSNISIPSSVTTIGNAFGSCEKLEYVLIPSSVTAMSTASFPNTTILMVEENSYAHTFAENNNLLYYIGNTAPEIYIVDGVKYFISDNEAIPLSFDNSVKELVIPSSVEGYPVTDIGTVFNYNNGLTSITLPDTITEIKGSAFHNCGTLKNVNLPNSITTIGANAFSRCYDLESITIPEGVISIGNQAFGYCESLTNVTLPNSLTDVGIQLFWNCGKLDNIAIPDSLTSIDDYMFYGCCELDNIILHDNITSVGASAFYDCRSLLQIRLPESITHMYQTSFPETTIMLVDENSYSHTFAKDNDHLYFVIRETANPEISYGAGISGTVTYTDGTAAAGAAVDILYDDGVVKESVTTDESGAYSFTYAEVGRYTIRVTDTSGHTDSEQVSIKRMNVFDVFLAGETDLTLKTGWTVSGTVNDSATVTLTDPDGNIIDSVTAADGAYSFTDVPNGSYIIRAEDSSGSASKEIHVFNADITENITIEAQSASIEGYVEIEERDSNRRRRNWAQVTLYNSEGTAIAACKTDSDGKYTFTKLALDEYSIIAEATEMRPDHHKDFHRSFTLTGYAYVNVEEAISYTADTIVLTEENDNLATISGKVTAQGENQACEVILTNVFRHEVASCTTGKNGKYTFKNIPDGLYFITAVTKSNGMGFTVVMVRHGNVYGETDIFVNKSDKIREHETNMNDIPHCSSRDDAENHRDKIINEKRYYDSLPDRKKKEFSQDYIDRLNHLIELLSECSYQTNSGTIHNSGMMVSGDELRDDKSITLKLTVADHTPHEIGDDGISTDEEFIQQSIEDAATGKNIAKYYDISLKKNVDGLDYEISNVSKHTDTTGKLRITLPIPEDYRGHKHYSFIHVHNGVPTTLIDLDDHPDTVTFEIDKFSTFALTYSDVEVAEEDESLLTASIADQKSFKEANITGVKINVSTSPNFVVSGLSVGYGTETRKLSEASISGGSTVLIGMFVPGLVTLTDNDFTVTSINETEE